MCQGHDGQSILLQLVCQSVESQVDWMNRKARQKSWLFPSWQYFVLACVKNQQLKKVVNPKPQRWLEITRHFCNNDILFTPPKTHMHTQNSHIWKGAHSKRTSHLKPMLNSGGIFLVSLLVSSECPSSQFACTELIHKLFCPSTKVFFFQYLIR